MELLAALFDLAIHLDQHLGALVAEHGVWVYALLFVTGALAAAGNLDIGLVMGVLIAATLTGDNVNYFIGRRVGPRVFH